MDKLKLYYYNDTGTKIKLEYYNNTWIINKYYNTNIFYLIDDRGDYSRIVKIAECSKEGQLIKITKELRKYNLIFINNCFKRKDQSNDITIQNITVDLDNKDNITKDINKLYKTTKLKINHVMLGPRCKVFDKIINKLILFLTDYKHIISENFDTKCDIFIIWRLRDNSPVKFNKKYLEYKKIKDNSYVFLHEDISNNSSMEMQSINERKHLLSLFNKFICTSYRQYDILKNNLYGNIKYIPLASLNDIQKPINTSKKIIGFIGYEYNNDIKNMKLFIDIISKLDKNKIQISITTNGYSNLINYIKNLNYDVIISTDIIHLDILLITSKTEGSPITVYECIKNNIICISTDVGNVSEILLPEYIYNTSADAVNILNKIINNYSNFNYIFKNSNYRWEDTCKHINSMIEEDTKFFKINDNNSKLLFVSMGTINSIYSDNINDTSNSLDKLNYNYFFEKVPNYGNWKNNTYIKASWIYSICLLYPDYRIIWIDLDSYIKTNLDIIPENIDISIPYIEYWKPNTNYKELMSGILYFKNNNKTLNFLKTWIYYNSVYYSTNKFEQENLLYTSNNVTNINIDYSFFTYKHLFHDLYRNKYPFTKPYIYQLQWSRITKNVSYSNINKEKIKSLIITNKLASYYNNEIYIVGGGDSIKNFNTNILKNKFVIGINSIIFENKKLDINFNMFITLDYSFIRESTDLIKYLNNNNIISVFYSDMNETNSIKPYIENNNLKYYYKTKKKGMIENINVNNFDYCITDEIINYMFKNNIKFNDEPITSGCAAIRLAMKMGFTNINLIGFDGKISNQSHYSSMYETQFNRNKNNFKGHIFNRHDEFKKEFINILKTGKQFNIKIKLLTPSSYIV